MARTTKKELISIITGILNANEEKEVCVVKYEKKLRNGRYGLRAYALCWRDMFHNGEGKVYARPWSGATLYWEAPLDRLKLAELQDIVGKCMMLNNPKRP